MLTACGGGGGDNGSAGGSSSSSTGGAGSRIVDNGIPLEYVGNNEQATITSQNVATIIYYLLGASAVVNTLNQPGSTSSPSSDLQNAALDVYTLALNEKSGIAFKNQRASPSNTIKDSKRHRISEAYDDTEICESGTVTYKGDIFSNGTGSVGMTFNSCRYGDTTMNGFAILHVGGINFDLGIFTKTKMTFNRLTIDISGAGYISSGSTESTITLQSDNDYSYTGKKEVIKTNIIELDEQTGKYVKSSDLIEELIYSSVNSQFPDSETLSGRIYDSDYGYITVKTSKVLVFQRHPQYSELIDGELRLSGADSSLALVTVAHGDRLWVEIYPDFTNNTVSASAFMSMDRLGSPEYSDISDSDSDGMPDSWEDFYGLDANNMDDANEDMDGDHINNYVEYLYGIIPNEHNTDFSSPPSYTHLYMGDAGPAQIPADRSPTYEYKLRSSYSSIIDTMSVVILAPPNFELGIWRDECESRSHLVFCTFSFQNATYNETHNGFDFDVHTYAPEEIGVYNIGAVVTTYADGVIRSREYFQRTIEIVPAYVALEIYHGGTTSPVALDNQFRYSVAVNNAGTIPSKPLTIALTYPDIAQRQSGTSDCVDGYCVATFNFNALAAGASKTVSIDVLVPVSVGPIILNSSIAVTDDSEETHFTYVNNEKTTELVLPEVDLLLEASYYKNYLTREDGIHARLDFVLGIFPHGTDPSGDYVRDLDFSVTIPPRVNVYSLPSGTDCKQVANTITCTRAALEDRWDEYITFRFISYYDGIYEITANVSSAAIDPEPSNNTVTLTTFIGNRLDDIQAQIDAADDGDTISIPPGYYYGDLIYQDKNINLVSTDGPDQTFISPLENGILPGPEGSISGFTFTYGANVITLNNSNVRISDNVFDHLNNNSDYFGGGAVFGWFSAQSVYLVNIQANSQPVIEKNILRNTNCGYSSRNAFRLNIQGSPVIRNNLFENNDCDMINITPFSTGAPVIVNNVFANSDTALIVPENSRAAGIHIGNNIIVGNNVGIETVTDCSDSCGVFQSNLFYNNGVDFEDSQNQIGVNGNISADPLFVDPDNSDYRLSIGSPAIDAGDATYAPEDDLFGNSRPADGDASGTAEPDIGAYERQ
jgi:hypothetical protein